MTPKESTATPAMASRLTVRPSGLRVIGAVPIRWLLVLTVTAVGLPWNPTNCGIHRSRPGHSFQSCHDPLLAVQSAAPSGGYDQAQSHWSQARDSRVTPTGL